MRILHVHSGNIFGGVERILIALAGHKRFSPAFEHTFALSFPGRLSQELSALGAPVFILPRLQLSRPLQILRSRAALRKLLRQNRYDLAIVHSAWSHVAFAKVVQSASLPLLFWLHTTVEESLLEKVARLRAPTRVLSVSKTVDATAHKLFSNVPTSVVYTPLALDEEAFVAANRSQIRRELGASENDVVILQASRLESWKGHADLLRALHQLKENPRWICWIAGGASNPTEAAYQSELKRLNFSDRIHFLGARNDIPQLLTAADIYCQPNLAGEGFSIAFIEACFAQLPIVTSAIGGATEIVDSKTGFLLPPGDVSAFADTLKTLIDNEGLRRQMGRAARERVLAQCDPKQQFSALEKVFRETANV